MEIKRGMAQAVEIVVDTLRALSRDVKDKQEIAQVGTIAANHDPLIGDLIAEAMEQVGKDGVITVEEGHTAETTLEVVEGMQFDRGYLSPYFVTDAERMEAVLDNPYILLHEKKLSHMKELLPVLEQIAQAGSPLLIIAEDVEREALATLVVNKLRGTLQCVAVKAPGFGERRKEMMQDIAVLTRGQVISEDLGMKLANVTLNELGRAKRVTITKEATTIVEGAGAPVDIAGRVKQLRTHIEETTSEYDRENLNERLAKLVGGVAVITVGAATEAALKEKKARLEDALNATRAAVEEGVVPGGGLAYIRALPALEQLQLEGDRQVGVNIIKRALEEPMRQIALNAGVEGATVVQRVKAASDMIGYDAVADAYVDLMDAGVLDPTKVSRTALQHAASVVGLLLTTEVLIAEAPEALTAYHDGMSAHPRGVWTSKGAGSAPARTGRHRRCQNRLACHAARTSRGMTSPSPLLLHHGNMLTLRKRPMHRLSSSTHPRESSTHERAIEALARQSHVPIDQVAQLYERELTALTVGARITGFLTILTTRKVREILRQRRHPAQPLRSPAPRAVDTRAQAQTAPPDRTVRSSVAGDRLNTDPIRTFV